MKATERKDYIITYTEKDGIFYPDLKLPEQTHYPIGKYGDLRLAFLKKHRRGTYTTLLTTRKLIEHLHETEQEANYIRPADGRSPPSTGETDSVGEICLQQVRERI